MFSVWKICSFLNCHKFCRFCTRDNQIWSRFLISKILSFLDYIESDQTEMKLKCLISFFLYATTVVCRLLTKDHKDYIVPDINQRKWTKSSAALFINHPIRNACINNWSKYGKRGTSPKLNTSAQFLKSHDRNWIVKLKMVQISLRNLKGNLCLVHNQHWVSPKALKWHHHFWVLFFRQNWEFSQGGCYYE